MKKYAKLVLASLFLFSMTAIAQEQTLPPGKIIETKSINQGPRQQGTPQVRAESMAKDLGLTDVEKAKVQALFEKHDAIFTKFRSEVSRDSPDFRERFKVLRDAQDKELESIIGTEKFQTWQKLRAERRQQMNNNNNNK